MDSRRRNSGSQMTSKQLGAFIGRAALYRPDKSDIKFEVEVADAREVFGRREVLIRPLAGGGSRWVNLESLTLGK